MLNVDGSIVAGISSADPVRGGFFSRLLQLKSIKSEKITYICPPCIALGNVKAPCKHRKDNMPQWIVPSEISKELYANDEVVQRENMGMVKDDGGTGCFKESQVEYWLRVRPRSEIHEHVRHIMVCVDPVVGTDPSKPNKSDFVVIAKADDGLLMGVLQLEVLVHADYEAALRLFLRELRNPERCKYTQNAIIVLDAEANNGLEADYIQNVALPLGRVVFVDDIKGKPGTTTTNRLKRDMVQATQDLFEAKRMRVWDKLITINTPRGTPPALDTNTQAVLADLEKQYLAYTSEVISGSSLKSENVVVFTGKGKNRTAKDDLCVTDQRANLLGRRFFGSNKFRLDRE